MLVFLGFLGFGVFERGGLIGGGIGVMMVRLSRLVFWGRIWRS